MDWLTAQKLPRPGSVLPQGGVAASPSWLLLPARRHLLLMKYGVDRRGTVNTISHQVEQARRGGSPASLAVCLHAGRGVSSEAAAASVYPRRPARFSCKHQQLDTFLCGAARRPPLLHVYLDGSERDENQRFNHLVLPFQTIRLWLCFRSI